MLQITLVRSPIGHPEKQRKVLRALGLGKINSSTIQTDCPSVRGMIRQIQHLVRVQTVGGTHAPEAAAEAPEGEITNEAT
jgi:large subunit ribosomal protein L30